MPKDVFSYKGYTSSLQVSIEDNCLYGRIEDIDDLVTYEAQTVEEARAAFQEAVEHYLQTCGTWRARESAARARDNGAGRGTVGKSSDSWRKPTAV